MTGLLTEKMKEGRKAVERVMERTEKSLRIAFDDYAGACDGAAEHLALQLAQAHYELDLARSQAADLSKQFNEEREKSAQRYFAGVEDCKRIVSEFSSLTPDQKGELRRLMGALV